MRILIAGAGIGGLTFVRALQYFHKAAAGVDCSIEIAEKASVTKDGVGIVLHPNGLNVMDTLGLSQDLIPFTNVIDAIRITRDAGDVSIDMHDVWGDGEYTRSILRKDLHALLARDITKPHEIPVKLRTECAVERIVQKGPEVIAQFENGDSSAFDLVIAADGVHSRIRQKLFPGTPAVTTNLLYFRFIAQNPGIDSSIWRIFEREEGSYGFIPLTEDRVHCFVQLKGTEYPCPRGEEELYLKRSIVPWNPLLSAALDTRCGPLHAGFAYMVPPVNWSCGHCVLLGDAAHAVSPTLSEGGSLAMEDALVLALALLKSASIKEAIMSYRNARQEKCMWAYRMALAQLNSMGKRRKSVLQAAGSTDPGVPTRLMAGMYKPFLENPVPEHLSINLQIK